jgi:hypothetical protein
LLVAAFQTKRTSRRAEATVVVGRETVEDSNDEPQVIDWALPLSVIASQRVCPSVGVPDRLVVMEVMAVASAVIE